MFEKRLVKKFNSIEEYVKWNNELINEEIFVKKYKVVSGERRSSKRGRL